MIIEIRKSIKQQDQIWTMGVCVVALLWYISINTWVLRDILFTKYTDAAALIGTSRWISERWMDFSPLYLQLARFFHLITSAPNQMLVGLNLICAAGTVTICYALLRRITSRSAALFMAFCLLFEPHILVYSGITEPEMLALFLLTLGLFYYYTRPWVSGLAFALGILVRPTLLYVIPLLLLGYCCFYADWKKIVRDSFQWVVPIGLALLLLCARHYFIDGGLSPLCMNPGTVFFEGNNPNSMGRSAVYPFSVYELTPEYPLEPDSPHVLYRLIARRIAGKSLHVRFVNLFWSKKALCFMIDYPRRTLKLASTKMQLTFHNDARHDVILGFIRERFLHDQKWPTLPWGVLGGLAIAGMTVGIKQWRRYWPFFIVAFGQLGIILVAYVSARQRMLLIPVWVYFAAVAWEKIRESRRGIWTALLALFISGVAFLPNEMLKEENYWLEMQLKSNSLFNQAQSFRSEGKIEAAMRCSCQSFGLCPFLAESTQLSLLPYHRLGGFARGALKTLGQPQTPVAYFSVAQLCLKSSLPVARSLFTNLVHEKRQFNYGQWDSSQPAYYLGLARLANHDREGAQAAWQEGITRNPGDPWLLAHLAACGAGDKFAHHLYRYWDECSADFFMGLAHWHLAQPQAARSHLKRLYQRLPEFRRGAFYYAAVLGALQEDAQARVIVLKILSRNNDPLMLEEQVLGIFQRLAEKPDAPTYALPELNSMRRLYGY